MGIYLGNLSTEEIEKRIGITLSKQEREELEAMREQNTAKVHGRDVWHCYDIPFELVCGTYDAAKRVWDIFVPHVDEMTGRLNISVEK